MNRGFLFLIGLLCTLQFSGCAASKPAPTSAPASATRPDSSLSAASSHWEPDIEKFEQQDAKTPPPAHPILFVGSSTIRIWKVQQAFPGLPVLNRGFGGSQTDDVVHFYDRVVLAYHPSTIVFYSGDNDLAAGKSVEKVVSDTGELLTRIRRDLPDAKLVFIAIKPSIARWKLIDKIHQANQQIEAMVKANPNGVVVSIEDKLLGADSKPRKELFRLDGLHLSDAGYAILDDAVRPYLTAPH
jgi:lysophospholipase L1-like esterase